MQGSVIQWAISGLSVLWWFLAGMFVVLLLTGSISGWAAWAYVAVTICVALAQKILEHKHRRLRHLV